MGGANRLLRRVFRRQDLHERALPQLRRQAASNPRLARLLDEIDRERARGDK